MPRRLKLSPWWLVAAIVSVATSYHYLQARERVTPWIFPDENRYAAYARAVAETGKATVRGEHIWQESLQSYLLAPAWSVQDVGTAFELSKVTSCLFFALTAVPVFLLARKFAPTWAALLASAGAVVIPAAIYGSTLMQEPFALPAATTAALLATLILERPTLRTGTCLGVTLIAGVGVRGELIVLPIAVLAALGLDRTARFVRSHLTKRPEYTVVAGVGIAAAAGAAFAVLESVLDLGAGVRSFAAASMAIAVVPMVALVGSFSDIGGKDRARAAFGAVALVFGLAFVAYAARKAATIPISLTSVEERNVVYVEPLAFIALAGWSGRLRLRTALVSGFALLPVIWSIALSKVAAGPILTENPGLSWFWHIGRSKASTTYLLMGVAVAAGLLMMHWASRGPLLFATGVVAAIAGSFAYRGDHDAARSVATVWFQPDRGWVDRAAGGQEVTILTTPDVTDLNGLELLYFWNRSIRDYNTFGGASLGIAGHQFVADSNATFPVAVDGLVLHTDLVTIRGSVLITPPGSHYRLSSTDPALLGNNGQRAAIVGSVTGRYRDGWLGQEITVERYPGARPSSEPLRLVVDTHNSVVTGPRRVVARLADTTRSWTIAPGTSRELIIPLRKGPFRLRLTVSPTTTAGPTDSRQISLQLAPVKFPGSR